MNRFFRARLLVCVLFSMTHIGEAQASYRNDTKLLGIGALAFALDAVLRKENSLLPQGVKTLKALHAWAQSSPKRGHWADVKKYFFAHKKKAAAVALLAVLALLKSTTIANWSAAEMPGMSGFKPDRWAAVCARGLHKRTVDQWHRKLCSLSSITHWPIPAPGFYYPIPELTALADQPYVAELLRERNAAIFAPLRRGLCTAGMHNIIDTLRRAHPNYKATVFTPEIVDLIREGIRNASLSHKHFPLVSPVELLLQLLAAPNEIQVSFRDLDDLMPFLTADFDSHTAGHAIGLIVEKLSADQVNEYFNGEKINQLFELLNHQNASIQEGAIQVLKAVYDRLEGMAKEIFPTKERVTCLVQWLINPANKQSPETCLRLLSAILNNNRSKPVLDCFSSVVRQGINAARDNYGLSQEIGELRGQIASAHGRVAAFNRTPGESNRDYLNRLTRIAEERRIFGVEGGESVDVRDYDQLIARLNELIPTPN